MSRGRFAFMAHPPRCSGLVVINVLCGMRLRRASTIAGPRLMQGMRKRRHLHPVAVYSKALSAVFPLFSGSNFAVKPSSLLQLFYCAAASVTPLHPPLFARLSCRHGVSRNADDIDLSVGM